ncbi:carbohydrate ABC transporter permease [Paenibacillus thermotolerans]|uniref:carbohydrate ABC transporter permease n=1 Tax=Paenibacillus thermotolerans TaxID=3027807 RepID=UPI002367C355|nr:MULTISPECIES: carbohydrate ABC transporter permease [unclassified Paenibacillus]
MQRTNSIGWAGFTVQKVILLFLTIMALFPIYFMIVTAFKTQNDYVANKFGLPGAFTFDNFGTVFAQDNFIKWFLNSTILTFGSVALTLVLAVLAGYAVAKIRFPGKKWVMNVVIALMIVPPVVMVIPLFGMMSRAGMINSQFGVILIYTGLLLPFSIYLLSNFFRAIPDEIIEAAMIDGCNLLQILFRIVVQTSLPAFITLMIVNSVWVWNELLISVIFLQDDTLKTLMTGLTVFKSKYTLNIPVTMAGLIISTLPIAIMYFIGQKSFVEGLTAGAVKG